MSEKILLGATIFDVHIHLLKEASRIARKINRTEKEEIELTNDYFQELLDGYSKGIQRPAPYIG